MNRDRKILAGILCAAFVLTSSAPIFSQQKQPASDVIVFQREKVVQVPEGGAPTPHPGEDAFFFVTSEMSFDGKLVKGAPYSAEAVTEITQTLGDGNRIVNKSTAAIYRDSEGRTRREQTLRAIGPFATGNEPPQTIFISDPVAGTSYMLDARTHVARKTSTYRFEYKIAPPAEGIKSPAPSEESAPQEASEPGKARTHIFAPAETPGPGGEGVLTVNRIHGGEPMMTAPRVPGGEGGFVMEFHGDKKSAKTESLGKQIVEGVEAEGTRTTVTIPAGEIGNERAIEILMERWYSPELRTVVMTRHSDPRFGETLYRLTNISRSEPAKSLFEVPADYTIKEGPAMEPVHVRTRKPIEE
ncbi:MAG TPA: hypothetical protein VN920_12400 [Pyrinomonadaceae bacterium]|nr:hypothetical protein [Pyrinomonadaceae bacterium]